MMSSDKLLDQQLEALLELRTIMYNREDDEVTLESFGSICIKLTSGDLLFSTLQKILESGYCLFIDNGHLVMMMMK